MNANADIFHLKAPCNQPFNHKGSSGRPKNLEVRMSDFSKMADRIGTKIKAFTCPGSNKK